MEWIARKEERAFSKFEFLEVLNVDKEIAYQKVKMKLFAKGKRILEIVKLIKDLMNSSFHQAF